MQNSNKKKLAAARPKIPAYQRYLPLLADLKGRDKQALGQDLLAGTITAILLVPQALAYALLAGLPAEALWFLNL